MSETITQSAIPCYGSVLEQREAGARKLLGDAPTYLRYGSPSHTSLEERVSELSGSEPHETLIFNSGMSAVRAAVEAGLGQVPKDEVPRILLASELYAGTRRWIDEEVRVRDATLQTFDASNVEAVIEAIDSYKPHIVLAETVGNNSNAPVLNHRALLEASRKADVKPLLVLDNTLPLSTRCDVYDCTDEGDNACIVESGTKAYALNCDTLGVAYSKNGEVVQALRARRNDGNLPGIGSARYINSLLPTSAEFHERNQRIFENTGALAVRLGEAQQVAREGFIVDHPSLSSHANYGQAHVQSAGNVTPVIFLRPDSLGKSVLNFAQKIGDDPAVREHIQICDSFAFDTAAFYSPNDNTFVRIAPGVETDVTALGDALYNALTK